MDITSILGFVVGMVLIIFVGITPAKLGNFWDAESVAIVLGGAMAAVIMSYPLSMLKTIPSHFKMLLQGNKYNIPELVNTLEEMAQLARKNGLLALEEKANELDDPFFKQGIMLIVDATEPEEVRALMENDVEAMASRHEEGIGLYNKASAFSPAFGMIGTLIGLINMLKLLDDPSSIGPNMAVALITTLYGSLIANWICIPVATKLRAKNQKEIMNKEVVCEGILSIQAGENPRVIEEKLKSFLAPAVRNEVLGGEGDSKQGGDA